MKSQNQLTTEEVYNLHLQTIRGFKNKPYTLRKNFDKFLSEKHYKDYVSVTNFLNYKSDAIDPVLFFKATAFYHENDEFIPIKEYTRSTSLTNYIQYKRHLDSIEIDNKVGDIKPDLKFIKSFCEDAGIKITDYLKYRKDRESKFEFLNHIKTRKINLHVLFAFNNFFDTMKEVAKDSETYNFYIPEHLTPFEILKTYNRSDKYKTIINQAKLIINKQYD